MLDNQVTLTFTQVHTANDTLHFSWELIEANISSNWDASICDNTGCYTTLLPSGTMLPVLPVDNGILLIHCTPHTDLGTAVIRYALTEASNPTSADTLTWIIHCQTAGTEELEVIPQISLNEGSLTIKGQTGNFNSCRIYDNLGRELVFIQPLEEKVLLPENTLYPLFVELVSDHSRKLIKLMPCQ